MSMLQQFFINRRKAVAIISVYDIITFIYQQALGKNDAKFFSVDKIEASFQSIVYSRVMECSQNQTFRVFDKSLNIFPIVDKTDLGEM